MILHYIIISNNNITNYKPIDKSQCNLESNKFDGFSIEEVVVFDESGSHYPIKKIFFVKSNKTYLILSVYNLSNYYFIKLPLDGEGLYKSELNIKYFFNKTKEEIPDVKVYFIEENDMGYLLIENVFKNGEFINMRWIYNNENMYSKSYYSAYCFKKSFEINNTSNSLKYELEILDKLQEAPENEWIKLESKLLETFYKIPSIKN